MWIINFNKSFVVLFFPKERLEILDCWLLSGPDVRLAEERSDAVSAVSSSSDTRSYCRWPDARSATSLPRMCSSRLCTHQFSPPGLQGSLLCLHSSLDLECRIEKKEKKCSKTIKKCSYINKSEFELALWILNMVRLCAVKCG